MPRDGSLSTSCCRWIAPLLATCILNTLFGCSVPSRVATKNIGSQPINSAAVCADEFIIELVRANDAQIPDLPLQRALERLSASVSGSIRLIDRGSIAVSYDNDGEPVGYTWPLAERTKLIERHREDTWSYATLDQPDGGIAGVHHLQDECGTWRYHPHMQPNAILIFVLDQGPVDQPASGFVRSHPYTEIDGDRQILRFRRTDVHLFPSRVARRLRLPLVSHDTYWEWLIVHEIGHTLGVPAAAARTNMKNGAHCIRPDCVMYSPADWRMVLQIILHGWSLDFCSDCAGELAAAREAARSTPPSSADTDSPHAAAHGDVPQFPFPRSVAPVCCGGH